MQLFTRLENRPQHDVGIANKLEGYPVLKEEQVCDETKPIEETRSLNEASLDLRFSGPSSSGTNLPRLYEGLQEIVASLREHCIKSKPVKDILHYRSLHELASRNQEHASLLDSSRRDRTGDLLRLKDPKGQVTLEVRLVLV